MQFKKKKINSPFLDVENFTGVLNLLKNSLAIRNDIRNLLQKSCDRDRNTEFSGGIGGVPAPPGRRH